MKKQTPETIAGTGICRKLVVTKQLITMANIGIRYRGGETKKPFYIPYEGTLKYQVYTLTDPTTNQIRYVGYTKGGLARRLSLHKSVTKYSVKKNPEKLQWILSLCDRGLLPVIETIDEADTIQEALLLECFWIDLLRSWGIPLLNIYYGRSLGQRSRLKIAKTSKNINSLKTENK